MSKQKNDSMLSGLDIAKRSIRKRFFGKNGIMGIGCDPEKDIITIYTTNPNMIIIKEIEKVAKPFKIKIINVPFSKF